MCKRNLTSFRIMNFATALLGAALLTLAGTARGASQDTNQTTFGFTGPETYPIDNAIANLRSADLDGDGLSDIVVVNNARSRINILYNQTGKTNAARPIARIRPEMNELPPDARFRIESITSEKRIAALVLADLNGDKRPDLAYFGEPKELLVQYNQGTNDWSAAKRWTIDDGQLSPNALAAGDLNGDGRADLVLLGETAIYAFYQNADKSLAEPEKIPFSGTLKSVQILDIDGDSRDDLLLVNWESPNPFRFRIQNGAGQLGPEVYLSFPPIRSYWPDDLDGDRKTEIITIAMSSGRAQVSNFTQKPADTISGQFKEGQFQVLPLNKTSKARRGLAWGDVNGDGRIDLLVAEPDSGQISAFLQQADGSLAPPKTFPTLTGVSEVCLAQRGQGEPADIYLLSPDERQVGVTRFDKQGRLPFPTMLPMDGKPLAMATGSLRAQDKPTLAVILDQDGKRVLYTKGPAGAPRLQTLSDKFKSNPSSVAFHDVNQDGLTDLLLLIPYEKIKVLRQVAGKDFDEIDVNPPGGSMEQPWFSLADVDGDGKEELLLAQKNFLRAVVLKSDAAKTDTNGSWSLVVKDQINGSASNSRIVGAAPLRNGTNAVASLFLLDAERKALTFSERDTNGVWRVVRNLPLPFTEFTGLQPIALGGNNLNTVAFLGVNALGWMPLAGKAWQVTELDGYETPIRDGQLHDVISGDLNGDGRKDLVFLETAKNYLDVVIFTKDRTLVPATRWQVFEQRTMRGRPTDQLEPREGLILDVTGDRKADLVVLVHDRVLVYPQE